MDHKNILLVIVAVLLLVGLFLFSERLIKPTNSSQKNSATKSPTTSQYTNAKVFELEIRNKILVSGPDTLTVTQGDNVVIKITSDFADELHLHGYDKSVQLEVDKPNELSFTANLTGRFDYELENSKVEIGALEVQPKQ